ncbi:hypothetical protein CDD81_3152 [Ophiocordyceps australis]|uniref:Uncharacterized protein n=1 Tax=Ophiocordyceps australis TaxID=1399860 RepID=A0A2C5XQC9_9HYPO|nr:hypothetical protein CDD81_3152 [Ophiocordyceps australis]
MKKLVLGRNGTYRVIPRAWPRRDNRLTGWLMPVELVILVPILVIFGISQPDLYRTAMWRIGFDNKLNSNPNMILYAYANHRPLPHIPLIWSSTLTNLNVAISIISLFFLLAKLIAFIMRVWYPVIAVVANVALIALYSVSIYGQIGPDYADSRYPAPAAWYLRRGCSLAEPYGKHKACQIAQGSLAITLLMLLVYLINLGLALHAMWPNKENDVSADDDENSIMSDAKDGNNWELQGMRSPGHGSAGASAGAMPFTPRTQAFHTLDRQLPLRQHA